MPMTGRKTIPNHETWRCSALIRSATASTPSETIGEILAFLSAALPSTRGNVFLATDLRHRQARFLQRIERRIHHVGIAAEVRDIAFRGRRQLSQHVLHMAWAIAGTRHGARLAAQAAMEGESR